MVNHDVVRFHVSVHDALAVAVVEGLEQLKNVVAHVVIGELGVQGPKVGIVDVFGYQRRRLALW